VTDVFDGSAHFVRVKWGLPDQLVVPLQGTSAPKDTFLDGGISVQALIIIQEI
jgi:hypothetical protein